MIPAHIRLTVTKSEGNIRKSSIKLWWLAFFIKDEKKKKYY